MALNRRSFVGTAIAAITLGRGTPAAQPTALGYFAPAEESPHARTWMCWPSTASIYKGPAGYFESVQETIGRLAAAIAEHEPVFMLVGSGHQALAARLCGPKVKRPIWATPQASVSRIHPLLHPCLVSVRASTLRRWFRPRLTGSCGSAIDSAAHRRRAAALPADGSASIRRN